MERLPAILGRIYKMLDRRTPKSPHRLLTTFVGEYDDVILSGPVATSHWDDGIARWDDGVTVWDRAILG